MFHFVPHLIKLEVLNRKCSHLIDNKKGILKMSTSQPICSLVSATDQVKVL